MWILLRLAASCLIGVLRHGWRSRSNEGTSSWAGEAVYLGPRDRESRRIGLAFPRSLRFELLPERRADRWLKRLGLTVEQETGDAAFDARVYICSDNTALGRALRECPAARAAVRDLFASGVCRIESDGTYLWADLRGAKQSHESIIPILGTLRGSVASTLPAAESHAVQRSLGRVALAEALIWSVAGYAVTSLPGLVAFGEAHPDWTRFAIYSAIAFGASGIVLAGGLAVLLNRTSWAGRVYAEAGVILALTLPVSSMSVVNDLNRALDWSKPVSGFYEITERKMDVYSKIVRGRGTEVFADYLVRVRPVDRSHPQLERLLPVTRDIYGQPSAKIHVQWKPGALGMPWVDSISHAKQPLFTWRYQDYADGNLGLRLALVTLVVVLLGVVFSRIRF